MDMDIDLSLESDDRIKEYLEAKLEEIQNVNRELNKSIKLRQEEREKIQRTIQEKSSNIQTKITNTWKKIVNNKYILGLTLSPPISVSPGKFNLLLDWNSSESLSFEFALVYKNLKLGLKCESSGEDFDKILITLPVPQFTTQLCYKIEVALNFGQNQLISVPSIEISAEDPTSDWLRLELSDFANEINILAYAFANTKYELVLVPTKPCTESFEQEIKLCKFQKLKAFKQNYYFVHNISPAIDGCLLELEKDKGSISINIYCRNDNTVLNLAHFFYGKTKNFMLIPRELHFSVVEQKDAKYLLHKSLLEEARIANEFFNRPDSKPDVNIFKQKVLPQILATDLLVAQIKNVTVPKE